MSAAPSAPLRMSAREWLLLIALSVLWGCAFLFQKVAVGEMLPFSIAFSRVAIAAVVLMAFVRLTGRSLAECYVMWPSILVMGFLNNVVPFSLVIWGQAHIPAGLTSILIATTPLFGVLIAHFVTVNEKITPARLAGVVTGFLGVVIMLGAELLGELGTHAVAQLACLGGALSYAVSGIYGRRFRPYPPAVIAAWQLTLSSVMLGLMVILIDRPWSLPPPSATALGAVVALGVFSTALAFIIFFSLLARAGATNTLLVNLLIPATAILLGALVLGERLAPRHFAGLVLIAIGLATIDGRAGQFAMRKFRAAFGNS